MTKAKTNALDALRTLIAERQQYEQWITALEARKEGTPEHVFDRVKADYQSRLERVVNDIRGHSDELQLSISTLSSRLVEVAREEDTRREGLQEAELRAAVGEYEPEQWDQLRTESERALEKIAADRASLDNQLGELRAIQKLSEVGSVGTPTPPEAARAVDAGKPSQAPAAPTVQPAAATPPKEVTPLKEAAPPQSKPVATPSAPQAAVKIEAKPAAASSQPPAVSTTNEQTSGNAQTDNSARAEAPASSTSEAAPQAPVDQGRLSLDPVAAAANAAAANNARAKGASKTPPGGMSAIRGKSDAAKPDSSKTLKCPECGTANYPTEWYCERCGGELATM